MSPSWKPTTSSVAWVSPETKEAKQPVPNKLNGDIDHHTNRTPMMDQTIGPDETLQSLLDRLSLSSHLNLFQVSGFDYF